MPALPDYVKPLVESISTEIDESVRTFQPDTGPPISSPVTQFLSTVVSFQFFATRTNAINFLAFYRANRNSVVTTTNPLLATGTLSAKFASPPSFDLQGRNIVEVTVQLRSLPDQGGV